jgi:hypothetical protein
MRSNLTEIGPAGPAPKPNRAVIAMGSTPYQSRSGTALPNRQFTVMLFWRSRLAGAVKGPEQRPPGGATVQLGRLNPKERKILRCARPPSGRTRRGRCEKRQFGRCHRNAVDPQRGLQAGPEGAAALPLVGKNATLIGAARWCFFERHGRLWLHVCNGPGMRRASLWNDRALILTFLAGFPDRDFPGQNEVDRCRLLLPDRRGDIDHATRAVAFPRLREVSRPRRRLPLTDNALPHVRQTEALMAPLSNPFKASINGWRKLSYWRPRPTEVR